MNKTIKRRIVVVFITCIFAFIKLNCLNSTAIKAYADQKPQLKNVYFSEGDDIDFYADVYSYIVDVDKDVDKAFIKAKPDDPLDIVTVNGKTVTKDNSYKQDIVLENGKNTIKIEVQDDKTNSKSTYFVYVYRGGKDAVYLEDILINDSTIGFEPSINSYNIELDQGTNIVELGTIPVDENHSIIVNGQQLSTTNSIKLKFDGIGKYTLNIDVGDKDTGRTGKYSLNIYLGIPVSPNVSDSINQVLKPNQWIIVNGRWRYNDALGNCLKNRWFYDDKYKAYFHFNNRGNMQTGWIEDDDNWYYLGTKGEMQTGWVFYENEWYYLDSNGVMQTGWVEDNGNWYYLRRDGSMATGWIVNLDQWYYLNSSGAMETGWIYYGKEWYLLGSSGAMQTGWAEYDGEWYYLNPDGSMKSGEWVYDDGKWYYINYYGNMRRGWLNVDDKYFYYFNEDGTMQTSPKTIDGYTYYFNNDGSVDFG
ncbi:MULTISPECIES: cadherin-like beta sandwich domain-containing protein [unclassified Clostridium]|uniref:cadherin-like beta sandwich domain-containing protein n=1 Tax=unclassified Clostridium TaxID=2614128 RepID=UPI000297B0AE|nr:MULTISPECIES: cadherin-like beta sandwich domain-containing protein [unclassified Clostridium]EKQ50512.1 MAG: putative cell wall binding protein [Clostridium sp. Maddingley MBC34-26]